MNIREPLTFYSLAKYVSDYDIFRFYCPEFEEVGVKFKSPFRSEKIPSAVVYVSSPGRLRFNDFLLPTMSSVEFVANMFNISKNEALKKIALDFKVKQLYVVDWGYVPTSTTTPTIHNKEIGSKTETIIQVRYRKWEKYDIEFWSSFGIKLETLKLFNVSPIDYVWVNDVRSKPDKYAYSYNYYWEEGIFRRKIYQPFGEIKWISNGGKVVQGEGVLPKEGELLIITKSLKDVMCLYEFGYNSIAPTTEKTLPSQEYIDKQKHRFNRIILFLDNDETGKIMSLKHSAEMNVEYILIPDLYGVKDISDFIKVYGFDAGKHLMSVLINEKIKI